MKTILATTAALVALTATTAFAEGDPAKGAKDFKKRCKSCHSLVAPDGDVVLKGGKTGPNLWGIIGTQAGTNPDFGKYGDSIVAAGEAGLVWDEAQVIEYVKNPKKFLAAYLDDSGAKSMMTFKLKKPENVAAYLATLTAE